MGAQISKIKDKVLGTKEVRVLMLGLDAAGKTSMWFDATSFSGTLLTAPHLFSKATLYRLKGTNQELTTIPTVGFNVETVQYKRTKFNIWDVGGQDKIRPLWRHYYSGTQAIIFVVDSSDRPRIREARDELQRILRDNELNSVMVLIFANKMDIPGRMSREDVMRDMWTAELGKKKFTVQDSCAKDAIGIFEGLVSCSPFPFSNPPLTW
jgi:ADP-ribosylation factor 6